MKIFTYIKESSERVKDKNFQLIGNNPLWKICLYKLKDENVYVDTDSEVVLQECNSDDKLSNITAYRRNLEHIQIEEDPNIKQSPALLMVKRFLDEHVTDENEVIVLTHVTSPFLKVETIRDAVKIYEQNNYEFVHSTHSVKDFAWLKNDSNPINFNDKVVQRTQDLDPIVFSNGAFFIFTKKVFLQYQNRLGKNNYFYNLSVLESIEIDTEEQLELCKIIMKGLNFEE